MAWRRSPRRMSNYSMDINEEYAQESSAAVQEKPGKSEFNESQNQDITRDKNGNDQDILLLLEKINLQLENMRLTEQNQQQSIEGPSSKEPAKENGLDKLVTLLQSSNTNKSSQNGDKLQNNSQKANDANALLSQLLTAKPNSSVQNQQENKSPNSSNDTFVLQTAAEVLSRAQYELSNELENSLKKLKQVISQSEQIANKISSLIDQKQQ